MLEAQQIYGPRSLDLAADGKFAAGRCLRFLLEEDRFDRQPLRGAGGALMLVSDLRLDNRDELLDGLGAADSDGRELSDSDILLLAWERWREGVLARLLGDFAFAIWDKNDESLVLARDPMGERPLFLHHGEGLFAFASMPQALALVPSIGRGVDEERLAAFVADLPPTGTAGFLKDISRVEPGHVVTIARGGVSARRYWDPRGPMLHFANPGDYGRALGEQIDQSVRRRLRRASGKVGAHLSGGIDSGAVSAFASAALAERGERLTAFTAAPRAGFDGPVPAGRIGDESERAAKTSELHSNIDHVVIRPAGASPLDLLEPANRLAGQPVGHVSNNVWWSAINSVARERGVSVILTGEVGNLTMSAGAGLDSLADLLRTGQWSRWAIETKTLARAGFSRLNLLNASLGPWLPKPVYRSIRRSLKGESEATTGDIQFVADRWKPEMARRLERNGWEMGPPRDGRDRRWTWLQLADPGLFRKRSLAQWGIEERDPTADRRLIETCFSLPPEALLRDGVRRPALRAALAGRIASEAMDSPLRGYQGADWHEQVDPARIAAFARAHRDLAGGFIDMDSVISAADSWPAEASGDRRLIYAYRTRLLRAISAADFARTYGGAPQ